MTKPFALDADGRVTVVGPPGLQCFLGADGSNERDEIEEGDDQ